MSVAEIQRAVVSIKTLPAEERIRIYQWAMAEMEPEVVYAAFDQAFGAGYYSAIMAETDKDYRDGNVLSEIY